MHFTFPQFDAKVVSLLDTSDANYAKTLYRLMSGCFQGKVHTTWNAVIHGVEEKDYAEDTFTEHRKDYLEATAEIGNLGDCLIRQLRYRGRPSVMPYDQYCRRRNQWLSYLKDKKFLRYDLALPTEQEWVEHIFCHQPKAHQTK